MRPLLRELVKRPLERHALISDAMKHVHVYLPAVQAKPAQAHCSSARFARCRNYLLDNAKIKSLLLGFDCSAWAPGMLPADYHAARPEGFMLYERKMHIDAMLYEPIYSPIGRMVADSGKMILLDQLLPRLKAGGHRVLMYSQMTKMIDLLEDYVRFRRHRYIRLDGSSKLEDRRDMVEDFQSRPEIFLFLLSTRAGGLGINLTAADTVIFYDSDWNPTIDQQV
jgi:DNA helicase INO80